MSCSRVLGCRPARPFAGGGAPVIISGLDLQASSVGAGSNRSVWQGVPGRRGRLGDGVAVVLHPDELAVEQWGEASRIHASVTKPVASGCA